MKNILRMSLLLLTILGVAGNAAALYIEGGDAASFADADDILDIVFVFDTSGSMVDEIGALVPAMQNIVNNIDCAECDVWVRATLMGITSSGYGLGESVTNYVTSRGGTPVSDHSEDNGPAVTDMVNHYDWDSSGVAVDQDYYKAVVTIGDEGTEDGYEPSGIDADDWAAASVANQAAIANGVLVFSVLGTPWPGYAGDQAQRDAVFSALAIGGTGYGYTLGDTGGGVYHTTANTIETDIETIICDIADNGGPDPIPEPATMVLFGAGLAALAGYRRKISR